MFLLRIVGKVLWRLFAEIRWVVATTIEAILHPLSASYVDPRTGKVLARYRGAQTANAQCGAPEHRHGGNNLPIAVSLVLVFTGAAIKAALN